jgi:hypothetical protein
MRPIQQLPDRHRAGRPAASVLLVALLALVLPVALAVPATAAGPVVHIGQPYTKVAAAAGGVVTVSMDVAVKSDRPVEQVRIYLRNTVNDDTRTMFAEHGSGPTQDYVWHATTYFHGPRNSAWRVFKVRVLGPGYRLLRSKTVNAELASVVAMYVDSDLTVVSSHRADGPPSRRLVRVSFSHHVEGPLVGLDARLTATFRRPGGSTFTRSRTTTTLDNGQAPQVLFGPYGMQRMTSLRIDGPAVHRHPVTWRF